MRHPRHEVDVDVDLVRRLLREQHPDLAGRELAIASWGWDNVTVRVGDDLAARLPTREISAPLVVHEQQWLPVLARLLPVAVPAPVRTGEAGAGYPWRWSVVPWFEGTPAVALPPARRDPWAPELARALAALHVAAPAAAPPNPFRGVPLLERDPVVQQRVAAMPDAQVLLEAWQDGLAAPAFDGAPRWLHGDLHPANLLSRDGGLAAMLDFGDLTAGDPATDLAAGWLCFGAAARERFWAEYLQLADLAGEGAALRRRARAWAASFAAILLGEPAHAGFVTVGEHAREQIAADLR